MWEESQRRLPIDRWRKNYVKSINNFGGLEWKLNERKYYVNSSVRVAWQLANEKNRKINDSGDLEPKWTKNYAKSTIPVDWKYSDQKIYVTSVVQVAWQLKNQKNPWNERFSWIRTKNYVKPTFRLSWQLTNKTCKYSSPNLNSPKHKSEIWTIF